MHPASLLYGACSRPTRAPLSRTHSSYENNFVLLLRTKETNGTLSRLQRVRPTPDSAGLVLQRRLLLRRAEEGVELIVGHGGADVLEGFGLRLELRRREMAKSPEPVIAR